MKRLRWAALVVGAGLLGAVWFAPVVYFEALVWTQAQVPQVGPRPEVTLGHWADDYFCVQSLDDHTFAIGEPRYYQGNYSYLLVGSKRALLFDAGSGLRDITPIVRSLTSLPVTVLPSHLHFDHVGALGRFERTAMADHAELRARIVAGELTLTRYENLGALTGSRRHFRVDEWWRDGQEIDLGGRAVTILHTPGHTPTSVSVWEPDSDACSCGIFCTAQLYAFYPGLRWRLMSRRLDA
jgi:glyoxylase-like metal-dependent hydrolase (beta-lactamase superfamily II)